VKLPANTMVGVRREMPFSEAAELADKFEQEFKAGLEKKDEHISVGLSCKDGAPMKPAKVCAVW